MGNEPDFDPLNATPAREDDMMRGYRAAGSGGDLPPLASVAFEPGWRMWYEHWKARRGSPRPGSWWS